MKERKISLITMGAGNIIALKKTFDSFKSVVDEFVYSDMLLFPEDREILQSYIREYNLRIFRLPFNYIFQMGFSSCLNYLASTAKNDLVIYMNTSEAIDEDYGINEIVNSNPGCNTFFFTHKTDPHRWYRLFDKRELRFSGGIHEELEVIAGDIRPYHKPIFCMKDYEKDMDNPFKAAVLNSVKEICYFQNYMRLVDNPPLVGATNEGWVAFAKDNYQSMKERLEKKGNQYEAFKTGNFEMFLEEIKTSDYFEKERFESSDMIEFQGDKKYLL